MVLSLQNPLNTDCFNKITNKQWWGSLKKCRIFLSKKKNAESGLHIRAIIMSDDSTKK